MNPKTYFQDIGLWPTAPHIGRVYVIGYILSLALTLGAYFLTPQYAGTPTFFIIVAFAFALAQFAVQLSCFLHLSKEISSRGRVLALLFVVLVVTIIVVGSLWIMQHLNQRMMMQTPAEMEHYMTTQQGI